MLCGLLTRGLGTKNSSICKLLSRDGLPGSVPTQQSGHQAGLFHHMRCLSTSRSFLWKSGPDESTLLSWRKNSRSSSQKLTGKKSKVIGIKRNVK